MKVFGNYLTGGVEYIQSIYQSTLDYPDLNVHKLISDFDTIPAAGCVYSDRAWRHINVA